MGLDQARNSFRMDTRKGKRCPGGYSIPRSHKCRTPGGKESSKKESRKRKVNKERRGLIGAAIAAPIIGTAVSGAGVATYLAMGRKGGNGGSPFGRGGTIPREEVRQEDREAAEKAKTQGEGGSDADRWRWEEFHRVRREAREKYERMKQEAQRRAAEGQSSSAQQGRSSGYSQGQTYSSWGRTPRDRVRAERATEFEKQEADVRQELGLGDNPTRREISRARKQAAKKYHRNGSFDKRMIDINAALDRLEERARQDSFGNMFFDMYPRWSSEYGRF